MVGKYLYMALLGLLSVLTAAAESASFAANDEAAMSQPGFSTPRMTRHSDGDDLLSAGLGLAGLRSFAPPPIKDPTQPTAAELRRVAIWNNWRGIADLSPMGGFTTQFGALPTISGREYSALAQLPGAKHPHRVLLQAPDNFDSERRCLLVAPASGSRGVYGGIAVAAAWALPRGCAVVYTDKGAGTGYFDHATDSGVQLDGRRGSRGSGLEFEPATLAEDAALVSIKHAHSGDLPEKDWGRHLLQAVDFGLAMLAEAYPEQAPFSAENTRIIAVGVSNGAGAVLRAAELDQGRVLDGAVAAAANISVADSTSLYDYATLAALLQPCLLADAEFRADIPMGANPALATIAEARCAALVEQGLLSADTLSGQVAQARAQLHSIGLTERALKGAAVNVTLDLWRAVAVTYASSYLRSGAGDMPCGYRIAVQDSDSRPVPADNAERALWWATGSGIAPSGKVMLLNPPSEAKDASLSGLLCLRQLWTTDDADAKALRGSVDSLRVSARIADLPTLVIHGMDDALIPEALSSGPWVAASRQHGAERLSYWQIEGAQHFDAFLGLPDFSSRYVPLLPYTWAALDRIWAVIDNDAEMPKDQLFKPERKPQQPVDLKTLGLDAR